MSFCSTCSNRSLCNIFIYVEYFAVIRRPISVSDGIQTIIYDFIIMDIRTIGNKSIDRFWTEENMVWNSSLMKLE